ncbi:hypothetical protein K440DRAFT_624363, partial [Wilcoxina mikolae CBS 423.85]
SSRFNETVLNPVSSKRSPPTPPNMHLAPPSPLLWPLTIIMEMDCPLPGFLCEAHLVRHISIAAAQAFGPFVLQVVGGRFVVGEPFVVMVVVLVVVVTHRFRTAEIVRNAH